MNTQTFAKRTNIKGNNEVFAALDLYNTDLDKNDPLPYITSYDKNYNVYSAIRAKDTNGGVVGVFGCFETFNNITFDDPITKTTSSFDNCNSMYTGIVPLSKTLTSIIPVYQCSIDNNNNMYTAFGKQGGNHNYYFRGTVATKDLYSYGELYAVLKTRHLLDSAFRLVGGAISASDSGLELLKRYFPMFHRYEIIV